jgi:hypothetical protein
MALASYQALSPGSDEGLNAGGAENLMNICPPDLTLRLPLLLIFIVMMFSLYFKVSRLVNCDSGDSVAKFSVARLDRDGVLAREVVLHDYARVRRARADKHLPSIFNL